MSKLDAASESLAEIFDPSLYEVKRGVPIFRSHRRKNPDGTEIVVTDADLPEIVANMRAREKENGVSGRINDGHITPGKDKPEKDQPPLLGYITEPRVGTFGPKKIPCVLINTRIKRSMLPYAKNKPFRSAEYYPQAKDITGLALMLRDPYLDLGVVNYAGKMALPYTRVDSPYLYAFSAGDDAMADMPAKVDNDDEGDLPPEEAAHYAKFCGYAKRWAKGHPKMYALMEAGAPAAGNTSLPASVTAEKIDKPVMNSGTGDPALYAKLEAQQQQIAQLLLAGEKDKCAGIVARLAVHYKLDKETELENFLTKTDAQRAKHEAYIRANYARTDEQIQVYEGHVEGGATRPQPTSDTKMKQAVSLASKEGITYSQALEKLSK